MFEIRMKIPEGATFPAFWLAGQPSQFNIFEGKFDSRKYGVGYSYFWLPTDPPHVHNSPEDSINRLEGTYVWREKQGWSDLANTFHTYTGVWTPTKMTFFFDGREVCSLTGKDVEDLNAPWDCANVIIASLQMPSWSTIQTCYMDIDYIKVYKPNNDNYNHPFKTNNEYIHHDVHENPSASIIPKVNPKYSSIVPNPNNINEVFFVGSTNQYSAWCPFSESFCSNQRLYKGYKDATGFWGIQKINYNYATISPTIHIKGDLAYHPQRNLIVYKGGDDRLQFFGKAANNYWHWWIDDNWSGLSQIPKVSSRAGSVVIAPNGNIFYHGTDNRIHYYKFINNDWIHFVLNHPIPPTLPSNQTKCKGDIVIGANNQVFFKGYDNRLQTFKINSSGNYTHGWIGSSSNPFTVNSKSGSIAISSDGLFYNGSDDKIHRFYWGGNNWLHQLLLYNYGSPTLGYLDADFVRGGVVYDELTYSVIYTGYDGRIQYFRKYGASYTHGWLNNYWNTDEYDADNNGSNLSTFSSTVLNNGTIYFKRKDGHLAYFRHEPCEVLNPVHGSWDNLRRRGITFGQTQEKRLEFSRIILYPNPTDSRINIELQNTPQLDNKLHYVVYNLQGKRVLHGDVVKNETSIDCSTLVNGIYNVVVSSQYFNSSAKFIKQ